MPRHTKTLGNRRSSVGLTVNSFQGTGGQAERVAQLNVLRRGMREPMAKWRCRDSVDRYRSGFAHVTDRWIAAIRRSLQRKANAVIAAKSYP